MTARSLVLIVAMVACGFAWHPVTEGDIIGINGGALSRLSVGHAGDILVEDLTKKTWKWVPLTECDGTKGTPNLKEHGWQPFPEAYYQGGVRLGSGGEMTTDMDGKSVQTMRWTSEEELLRGRQD